MFFTPPPPPIASLPPITIWVHGTRPGSVLPFLEQQEKVSAKNHTQLKHLSDLKKTSKTTAFLHALCHTAPELFPHEHFYSFKWSGDLTIQARKDAAQKLYTEIKQLMENATKKYGVAPPLTIITHSHGGNVVLYMKEYATEDSFCIDKTIFLACPVQKETALHAHAPFFGKIYSIHSHDDIVQIIDPQRIQPYKTAFDQKIKSLELLKNAYLQSIDQPLFSDRHFPPAANIIHANIAWESAPVMSQEFCPHKMELFMRKLASKIVPSRRGVFHTEFVTPYFIRHLPAIMMSLDNHRALNGMLLHDIELLI